MSVSMETAKDLYHACMRDDWPSFPTIVDFFGDAIRTPSHEVKAIVLGVYQGLVCHKDVSIELLHNCMMTNRLNELVHAKYKHQPSDYYKCFCQMGINLNQKVNIKALLYKDTEELPILDDDHCPNCGTSGFVTKKNHEGLIDCAKCLTQMCKFCVSDVVESICKKCT